MSNPTPAEILVVPLKAYRERMADADHEGEQHWKRMDRDMACRYFAPIAAEHLPAVLSALAAWKARAEELAEALEDLASHQNGPPLPSYENGWNRAMEKARRLLSTGAGKAAVENATGGGK